MVDSAVIYISASSDLQTERDLLSKSITEIPVTLGWQIHLSPIREKQVDNKAVEEADIHMVLLGSDIRAPVGFEWYLARLAGRYPILLSKSGISRTLAAQDFFRNLANIQTWQSYENYDSLRRIALMSISRILLSESNYFELSTTEIEQLSDLMMELKKSDLDSLGELIGGTGEDSVILSPERYVPSNGVLIHPPQQNSKE